MSPELALGLRLFQAGKLREAAEACARHLVAAPGDPRGLHLLGSIYLKAGQVEQAVAVLERAASAAPSDLQVALSLGAAERSKGRVARAAEVFERATQLAPRSAVAWFDLGLVRRDEGRLREATLAFLRAAALAPGDFDAAQNVVTSLAIGVRRGEKPFDPPAPPGRRGAGAAISIVVCNKDPGRWARFEAALAPHLAERTHEIVVIRDAVSLTEGYRRGWEQTRYPIVVFCHDDFAILSRDPFDAVEAALERADIVGLAGSTLACGPAVLWAGHPHIHGWLAHPARDGRGYDAAILSLKSGVIPGMQALDGVFMAMRRDVPARVGFDETTFDGFHFYDLDFTYRAARAGLRLAVTTDVVGVHESTGRFDAQFAHYAARFLAKFPALSGPRGTNHWYEARFADAAEVLAFCDQLRALGDAP